MENVVAPAGAKQRFVPASQLDFSRYAKNLAWLLKIKLQQGQEMLSRIYGYEHLHELQQAMKSGLKPGPFWDDGPSDGDATEGLSLLEGMPGERSMRPVRVLLDWKRAQGKHPWLEEQERFVVELGLTDSPASHRDCVRRVKSYLKGEWSVDAHGYPTGFWSFLAGYNIHSDEKDAREVAHLLQVWGREWMWREGDPLDRLSQKKCVAMSRAVDVLIELGKLIEHPEVSWNFGFQDDDQEWQSMWKGMATDREWGDSWEVECAEEVFGFDTERYDEERVEALCDFVKWPTEEKLKRCKVEISFSEASEKVGKWRLGWMMAAAEEWSEATDKIVGLTGQTSKQGSHGLWVPDSDYVSLVMRRRPQFDYEQSIKLMDVVGTLVLEKEDGSTQVGGLVQGWHFCPVSQYYADFDAVDEFLAPQSPQLGLGWGVLRQYMAMRGFTTMKQWVSSEEGCGMTLLTLRMAPGVDTDECRARFITLIAECFDEEGGPYTESDDKYFDMDEIAGLEELYMQTDELTIVTPGLIVISVDGIESLAVSIADDDGEGRQIMVRSTSRSSDSRTGLRMYSRMGMRDDEKEKRLRARKLLERVGDVAIDVAVLDVEALGQADGEEDDTP